MMNFPDDLLPILRNDVPLASMTWLKIGGPAQFLLTPESPEQLIRVLELCASRQIPCRLLGGGSNILVKDVGVSGAVIQLTNPVFSKLEIEGQTVRAGAGALLSHVVTESVRHGLAGLENLAGIPGTVGGAIHGNAGGRHGDIGQYVSRLILLTAHGERVERTAAELNFEYRTGNLDEMVVLEAHFQLQADSPESLTERLRKIWITKKSSQPLSSQSAGCIFKNPRGLSAGSLIEQAGLKGTKIGNAEISDRHANFIVTTSGASSEDVTRLIELVRSKVNEQFAISLELEIQIW